MNESTTRFGAVSRRAFLGGLSIAAIAATGACGASTSGSAAPSTTAPTEPATSTTPSPSASSSASSASSKASTSAGGQLPAGAKATVSWTYAAAGGMARNPYMAVWIEDAQGAYVKTLALYHRASGDNWLRELSGWYTSSGGTDTTTSGTVPAGSYTAAWDGSAAAGGRVQEGRYYVCVESAVEHGSDSLVRQQVTFGSAAATTTLDPSGSIAAAAVAYTV